MANEDAGRTRKGTATEDEERAHAVGARKPGVVGKMVDHCRETVEGIRLPRPDWRTFAWGLLLLILVAFIVANWAPLRINLFGWYLDAPRAVVLAIVFILGMVTAWLIEVRNRRGRAAEAEKPEEAPPETEEEAVVNEMASEPVEPTPREFAREHAEEPADEDEDEDEDDWFAPAREAVEEEVRPSPEDFAEEDAPASSRPEEFEGPEESEEPSEAPVIEKFAASEENEEFAEDTSDEAGADTREENGDANDDFALAEDIDSPEMVAEDETAGDALSEDFAFDEPADDFADLSAEEEPGAGDFDEADARETDPEFEPAEDDEADDGGPTLRGGAMEDSDDGPFWKFWAKGENAS